jgi:excisionase family DNA binding protein
MAKSTPNLPNPEPLASDILTADELAGMLHLHVVTVRLMAKSGEIPGRQIGNRWRFSRSRIVEWIAK